MTNLTAIAEQQQWHLASIIEALQTQGFSRGDAEAFAGFICCDHAEIRAGRPEDYLTDEQWDRLDVNRNEWTIS